MRICMRVHSIVRTAVHGAAVQAGMQHCMPGEHCITWLGQAGVSASLQVSLRHPDTCSSGGPLPLSSSASKSDLPLASLLSSAGAVTERSCRSVCSAGCLPEGRPSRWLKEPLPLRDGSMSLISPLLPNLPRLKRLSLEELTRTAAGGMLLPAPAAATCDAPPGAALPPPGSPLEERCSRSEKERLRWRIDPGGARPCLAGVCSAGKAGTRPSSAAGTASPSSPSGPSATSSSRCPSPLLLATLGAEPAAGNGTGHPCRLPLLPLLLRSSSRNAAAAAAAGGAGGSAGSATAGKLSMTGTASSSQVELLVCWAKSAASSGTSVATARPAGVDRYRRSAPGPPCACAWEVMARVCERVAV